MNQNTADEDMTYVRKVAEILEETGLAEIAVRRTFPDGGRLSVRLARQLPPGQQIAFPALGPSTIIATGDGHPSGPASQPRGPEPNGAEEDERAVPSPMVGTAYLAPEPGAAPYVTEGMAVKEGETLLIVEAMKTLNPIPAPHDGVVEQVLVADGEPVEYGTPLVILA